MKNDLHYSNKKNWLFMQSSQGIAIQLLGCCLVALIKTSPEITQFEGLFNQIPNLKYLQWKHLSQQKSSHVSFIRPKYTWLIFSSYVLDTNNDE